MGRQSKSAQSSSISKLKTPSSTLSPLCLKLWHTTSPSKPGLSATQSTKLLRSWRENLTASLNLWLREPAKRSTSALTGTRVICRSLRQTSAHATTPKAPDTNLHPTLRTKVAPSTLTILRTQSSLVARTLLQTSSLTRKGLTRVITDMSERPLTLCSEEKLHPRSRGELPT